MLSAKVKVYTINGNMVIRIPDSISKDSQFNLDEECIMQLDYDPESFKLTATKVESK